MSKYKIVALIANHTNNNLKHNISLNNIILIKKYVNNITIIDTKNEKYAIKLHGDLATDDKINNYLFIDNDNYFDFGKWVYALKNIKYTDYDYILCINDSIILTKHIYNYFHYIDNVMKDDTNLYAYNDSTQIKYHYQSYCFLINVKIIKKFINFFESKKSLIHDLNSLVHNVELNMCNIDDNHDCFLKIGNEYNMSKNLYWENEVLYQYLLSKNIFGIIKIKKIYDIYKDYKINIYGESLNNFDYIFYKNTYDDMKNLDNSQLFKHFIQIGQYEGRRFTNNCNTLLPSYYREKLDENNILYFFDIPIDFDIYFYKKNYTDVKYLTNTEIIFHYIHYGIYEGRNYNKIDNNNIYLNKYYLTILNDINININDQFNIYSYILLNSKIHNFTYMNAIKHYINYGINEKLLYKTDDLNKLLLNFDCNMYKKINNNLLKLSNIDLIKHYISNSDKDKNKYKLPNDFDYEMYKKIYKDLSNLNNEKLAIHYLEYGINEKRIYKIPDDFDCDTYKKIYKDINGLNNNQIESHYLEFGIKENRIYKIPDDFDCDTYKKIYKDVINLNNKDLKNHYLEYGINEKRIYKIPYDFECNTYKKIYKDVINLNDKDLKNHYLTIGINEKRIYKIPNDFDSNIYKKIYKDLSEFDVNELKKHYLEFGINEKRIYKIPDDFNADLYKKNYKDLSELDENALKKHYLEYGIYEKRIYILNILK